MVAKFACVRVRFCGVAVRLLPSTLVYGPVVELNTCVTYSIMLPRGGCSHVVDAWLGFN